ncbi:MAG TPA: GNAT family N-acetyltransferase [Pyrinomonadaceae bacterium]|jgi:RimJ/RimL family protein N-acetyltransferase
MSITFRAIEPQDEGFLLKVYASTRTEELERVPWNEAQRDAFLRMQFAAQHQHYRERYPDAAYEIIFLNQEPVGRLYVARLDEEFRIIDITILPEHRGGGVGTSIIKGLLNEASESGKPVRIYVESFNPSLRLFERLGFTRIDEHGVHWLMQWQLKK